MFLSHPAPAYRTEREAMMKPKELVALRAEMAEALARRHAAGDPWRDAHDLLYEGILKRLNAIEDELGLSYVMPPHEHTDGVGPLGEDRRGPDGLILAVYVPYWLCAVKGCRAKRYGNGVWVEPEES